jgi:hypothetical protein
MNTQPTTTTNGTIWPVTELLVNFANKKPCLEFSDYGDYKIYKREAREITKDLHDFRELLIICRLSMENEELETLLSMELKNTSGRLGLDENGRLYYHVGQYFPTEFRPAACRILRNICWQYIRDTRPELDGHGIRAYFKKRCSRRLFQNYFK